MSAQSHSESQKPKWIYLLELSELRIDENDTPGRKRRPKRFHNTVGAFAIIHVGHSKFIGKVVDMNEGGLAVRYASSRDQMLRKIKTRSCGVEIVVPDGSFVQSKRVPAEVVYDVPESRDSPSHEEVRRCGLKFRGKSEIRLSQLKQLCRDFAREGSQG